MRKGLLIQLVACLTVLAARWPRTNPRAVAAASFVVLAKLTLGEFLIDPPTLINLGFEWRIDGDDNRNAQSKCISEERR